MFDLIASLMGLAVLAWLLSPMILLAILNGKREEVSQLRHKLEALNAAEAADGPPSVPGRPSGTRGSGSGEGRLTPSEVEDLLLLRLEVKRLARIGSMTSKRHRLLLSKVDGLLSQHLLQTGAPTGTPIWISRRARAWDLLMSATKLSLKPPWLAPAPPAETPASVTVAEISTALSVSGVATGGAVTAKISSQEEEKPAPALSMPPVVRPLVGVTAAPTANEVTRVEMGGKPAPERPLTPGIEPPGVVAKALEPEPEVPPAQGAHWVEPSPEPAPVWQPVPPDRLERALLALSGWPRLIVPFLVQNIGWFIGGFCLIAGVFLLIAYTSGFLNDLLIFGSLLGSTALLLWGGHQLRHQRPELVVASNMLLTLGMLLGPLDLAVAVGLFDASGGNSVLILVSLLLAVGTLGAFVFAAALASTLLDPALHGPYPRLMTALAGLQFAVPLAGVAGMWPVLAGLHALLLVLLGYALRSFIDQWLRRIFLDQRSTTYFAAGLLVYTATLSFIHLTSVWPEPPPLGYTGLLLMALCALLLPVDAAFKEWVHKSAFLSRFTFAIYGLSAIAVAIAAQSIPVALPTLALGAGLYGWMTWRYRTWPPLYLLLACLAGLYGLGILHHLPPAWHGMASLPGLLVLLGWGHWAKSRSRGLALQCLLTFGLLLIGLTVWSLLWTARGEWLGVMTAATAALLIFAATRLALRLTDADPRWALGDAAFVVLATTAAAYLPDWPGFSSAPSTALDLLALATLWTWLGLYPPWPMTTSRGIFVTSALASLVPALGLGGLALVSPAPGGSETIPLLTLAGALLLWFALKLRQRPLVYAVLACAAGVGVLVKRTWFPGPPTGLVDFGVVVALWSLLWRIERRARLRQALGLVVDPEPDPLPDPEPDNWQDLLPEPVLHPDARSDRMRESSSQAPIGTLLDPAPSLTTLIRVPLEQAMALMWALGLFHLGQRTLADPLAWSWPGLAAFAAASGVLVVGYFHRFPWVVLPWLLALASLLVGLARMGLTLPWLGAVAVLSASLSWRWGRLLLARPATERLAAILCFTVPGGVGGRRRVEETLSAAALLITTVPVVVCPALVQLGVPAPELLPTLASSLLVLVLVAWHALTPTSIWTALTTLTIGAWVTGVWLAPSAPAALLGLGQPLINLSLCLGLAVAATGIRTEAMGPLVPWRGPMVGMSWALYLLTLVGTVLGALADDPLLPLLLGLLCLTLFPVSRTLPGAPHWRGFGLALLASALVWSLTVTAEVDLRAEVGIALGWGYLLVLSGNLLLPVWNERWPVWAVTPSFWPPLGVICGVGGLAAGVMVHALSYASGLAGLASYLFLILGNTVWPGVAWLAVALLAASGLLATGALDWAQQGRLPDPALDGGGLMLAALWTNLLLVLVPLWRRFGPSLAKRLAWRQDGLDGPLVSVALAIFALLLVLLLRIEAQALLGLVIFHREMANGLLTGWALLLALTAAHAYWLSSVPIIAHSMMAAFGAVWLAIALDLALPPAWLPWFFAMWYATLVVAPWLIPPRWERWRTLPRPWRTASLWVSIGLLIPVSGSDWAAVTLTLVLLALATLAHGWWEANALWLKAGMVLVLIASYSVWLAALGMTGPPTPLGAAGLLPWYALQTALLSLVVLAIRRHFDSRPTGPAQTPADLASKVSHQSAHALAELSMATLALTLLWLGLHLWLLLLHQLGTGSAVWLFGPPADPLAAGVATLLLTGLAVRRAWQRPDEPGWIYAAAMLLTLLAGYARLVMLGLAPFTPWDTGMLMGVAGAAFLLYQFTQAKALLRLTLVLPLLALATAPWHFASAWTGSALLAAAVLYLSMAGRLHNPWPAYLGVLALNGAVYLWAPLWAERFQLWQLNIVPAATSVLVLLHLHRRELRPSVLHGGRLAALSALYAGAGLDLFLRPDLGVFALALGLALIGIVLGIALRIRAFLYLGVTFLVLNVSGQLIRFYPESGLGRALILIGLGIVITAGMVFFSLKREAVLRRIRIARADLAEWH